MCRAACKTRGFSHTERNFRRIAMHDFDLIERHAKLIDHQLSERRFVTLAVAVRAREHRHAARGVHPDVGNLIQARAGTERSHHGRRRDAAGFQVSRDPDAAQFAVRLRRGAACLEAGPIGVLQRDRKCGLIVATVVLQRHGCLN